MIIMFCYDVYLVEIADDLCKSLFARADGSTSISER